MLEITIYCITVVSRHDIIAKMQDSLLIPTSCLALFICAVEFHESQHISCLTIVDQTKQTKSRWITSRQTNRLQYKFMFHSHQFCCSKIIYNHETLAIWKTRRPTRKQAIIILYTICVYKVVNLGNQRSACFTF